MASTTTETRQVDRTAAADRRWRAILARDAAADGRFVYGVRSTGVYCRPNCASRLPRRENVLFFESPLQAEVAGYRACRRCQPNRDSAGEERIERLVAACRFIESSDRPPTLGDIARHVDLSPHYLQRLFRARLGISPREYSATVRDRRLRDGLERGESVTKAMLGAGFESPSRLQAHARKHFGMTPRQLRARGANESVRFGIAECTLGHVLVATTDIGVCKIALGDDRDILKADLLARFSAAREVRREPRFAALLRSVVRFIDEPARDCPFPLDIRGTAFQRRVWQALQQIPPGETRTYAQLAAAVGSPSAVRAVASACAANTLAIAVPCHRVVRSGGAISGYRWGPERKRELLRRESGCGKRSPP